MGRNVGCKMRYGAKGIWATLKVGTKGIASYKRRQMLPTSTSPIVLLPIYPMGQYFGTRLRQLGNSLPYPFDVSTNHIDTAGPSTIPSKCSLVMETRRMLHRTLAMPQLEMQWLELDPFDLN
jgi:hypothetical protein